MRMGLDYNVNTILREAPRVLATDPLVRDELIRRGEEIRGILRIDFPSMTASLRDFEGRPIPITDVTARAIGTIATSMASPPARLDAKEPVDVGTHVPGYARSATQRAAEWASDRKSALGKAAQAARHLERIGRRELARAVRRQAGETWP